MNKSRFALVLGVALCFVAFAAATNDCAAEETIKVGTTMENLMTAYTGEMNAHVRYLAFAEKADKEGYDIASSLFRAAADAERVHFEHHAALITKLGGTPDAKMEIPELKGTKDNLEAALKGETYESTVMYPAFEKQAKKENVPEAVEAFDDAGKAEAVHVKLYAAMIKNLTFSEGLTKDFYVCPTCGNIVDALTRSTCPICGVSTKKFKKVK